MITLEKTIHLFLGLLLTTFGALSEANAEEYRWGKIVCTPTSTKHRSFNNKIFTILYAPATSCRCEKNPESQGRAEVQVDKGSSMVTIFATDESGKRSLWGQFHNCRIAKSSDWDCTARNTNVLDGLYLRRMTSHEALLMDAEFGQRLNFVETVIKIPDLEIGWGSGSCMRKDGWNLRGLFGK